MTSPEPGVNVELDAPSPARRLKFPTALTVLAVVLLLVWIAAFFIPAGLYDTDQDTGSPIPGTYHKLPDCGDGVKEPCASSEPANIRTRGAMHRIELSPRRASI